MCNARKWENKIRKRFVLIVVVRCNLEGFILILKKKSSCEKSDCFRKLVGNCCGSWPEFILWGCAIINKGGVGGRLGYFVWKEFVS